MQKNNNELILLQYELPIYSANSYKGGGAH